MEPTTAQPTPSDAGAVTIGTTVNGDITIDGTITRGRWHNNGGDSKRGCWRRRAGHQQQWGTSPINATVTTAGGDGTASGGQVGGTLESQRWTPALMVTASRPQRP